MFLKHWYKKLNFTQIIHRYMISCGYIIMIIVDSCIIWFHLDCIMQLKKSYYMYIVTNVSSRKSATTFCDLPDWLVSMILAVSMQHLLMHTCGMMTSSNGNIFRVTGPFCWEFTGHLWIPLTKASDAELWYFLWSAPWKKKRLSKQWWGWWSETPSC